MVRSALFLVGWGVFTFGVVIGLGALFGARPAAAELGVEPVRWTAGEDSVGVCTRQAGRPSWISAGEFNEVVAETARSWSQLGSAIRIDYRGDCAIHDARDPETVLNEISWDLVTFFERPGVDSITLLETTRSGGRDAGVILGGRIVLRPWLMDPATRSAAHIEALRGLVGHEFGHLLGLTHSDVELDLMYGGPVSARQPSAADAGVLTDIYDR